MYKESFRRYIENLASKNSTPGGGSASSLVSCLGTALLSMACNFTLGEKYKDREEEMRRILKSLDSLRERLEELVDEDIYSYKELLLAYKLPKDNVGKKKREEKIQSALRKALEVPFKICEFSLEAIRLSKIIVDKANPNLITDVGGGVLFLEAGFNSAVLNVEINLKSLKDKELNKKVKSKIESWRKEVVEIKEEVLKKVYNKILNPK